MSLLLWALLLWATPARAVPVAIHFEEAIVATTGRPNLALVLTVGAWP